MLFGQFNGQKFLTLQFSLNLICAIIKYMNWRMNIKKMVFAILSLIAVLVVILVSNINEGGSDSRLRIGATYMTMNNPFYSVIDEELRLVIESRGDILLTRDPALSQDKQNAQIQDLLEEGIDLLVLNPVNFQEITPMLERVKAAGVPVVVVDSQVSDPSLVACTIASDNYRAGVLCAEHLIGSRPDANIALLEHHTAQSAVDRINGFCDTIEQYDGYHVVAQGNCDGQLELAMPVMRDMLENHEDINVVMALNDPSALGAMAAMKELDMLSGTSVYGVDGAPEAKTMIMEGAMTATIAQFPIRIGQQTAQIVYQILSGEAHKDEITVPVELVTSSNVNQFDINGWQ